VGLSTRTIEQFLASSERRAFRMAEIATGNREEALDLVQDAMYKLVRHYARKPEEEWGPLFTRIVQSGIRDWYRRNRVRSKWRIWLGKTDENERESPLEQLPGPDHEGPEAVHETASAMEKLQGVLRELPLRQQQAFLLRNWEGLDVAETARAMGCSTGSVKTHYSRAVHRLREQLEGYWP